MTKNPRAPSETRFPSPINQNGIQLSDEDKINLIAERFRDIMIALGLDITDESLAKTPNRVAKMFVKEVFTGLDPKHFPEVELITENCSTDLGHSLILTKASFTSFCEHHFVPMIGQAYVAYIPQGKVIGLSKIPRIVRFFANRPQLQERLTAQVGDSISLLLNTPDVAVSIQAQHFCVMARGVRDENGATTTTYLSGAFKHDPSVKEEFFRGISRMLNQKAVIE